MWETLSTRGQDPGSRAKQKKGKRAQGRHKVRHTPLSKDQSSAFLQGLVLIMETSIVAFGCCSREVIIELELWFPVMFLQKKGENQYGRGKGEIERGRAGEGEGEAELLAVLWSWEIKFGNHGLSRTNYSK